MSKETIRPILQEIEYGTIKIKLDEIMKSKNISTYQLNTKSNIRFQ